MASIQKRSETSFRIIVSTGYDANGKKIIKMRTTRRPVGFTDKAWQKELDRQAAEFESSVLSGTYFKPADYKLSEFITKWLEEHGQNLENKTLFRYEGMLNGRVNTAMGHLKLDQIKPMHLLDFYKNLAEVGIREDTCYTALHSFEELLKEKSISISDLAKGSDISERTLKGILAGRATNRAGKIVKALNTHFNLNRKLEKLFTPAAEVKSLSSKTIGHYHRVLSVMFSDAVRWGFMKENPCEKVQPPKVAQKEMKYLDEEEVSRFLECLQDEPIKTQAMIMTALVTGCRRGEIAALQWPMIDLNDLSINVCQSAAYTPDKGIVIKRPKTPSSIRKIAIPETAAVILKQYRKWQMSQKLKVGDQWLKETREECEATGKEFNDPEWVFSTWNGHNIHPDTLTDTFKKFLTRHGLPDIRLHDIRHTACTMLLHAGLNVRAVASRMGHANPNVTLSVYAHALKSADREAANILGNMTSKKNETLSPKQENAR